MNNIKKAFKDKSRLRCMADGGYIDPKTQLGVLGGDKTVGPGAGAKGTDAIFKSTVNGVPTFTDQAARPAGASPYTQNAAQPLGNFATNQAGRTATPDAPVVGAAPVQKPTGMAGTAETLGNLAGALPVVGPAVNAGKAVIEAVASKGGLRQFAETAGRQLSPQIANTPLLQQSPYEKMNGLAAGSRSTPESNVPSWVRGSSAGGLRPGGLDPNIIANAAKFDQPADTRPMWQRAPKMDIGMTSPVANGQFGNVGQPQTAPAPMWQRQPMQDVGMDYISKTGGYGPTKKPEPVAQMADGGRVAPRSGPVRGPGGPTDDKVPAMLSDGEYVLPADTVKAVGVDKLNALRDATHTPTGKAKYQQGLRRYNDGDYVYRVDTKGNAIPTSNAPGGRAMIPAGPAPGGRAMIPAGPAPGGRAMIPAGPAPGGRAMIPAGPAPGGRAMIPAGPAPGAPPPGAPGSAAYRFVNAQTTPALSAIKNALRINGAGLAAGGATIGALDTLDDSPQFIANYDNAMGLDPNAGPVARTFASDIPRVLERTGDAIGFGLPGRIGRGIAESIGGGSFMTGFASNPNREAPRNTGAAPVAEATNEPEAQTGSAKPTPTRTTADAPNGMNEIQREALGAARSQLRDRGGGGYYAQVPRSDREINARYDKLGRELRGMYSSKGQGNLARKLLELEAARGRELGFDQRGAIDLAGMNSGANTAANAQRNQARMAAANDLSALGNTQAMTASNSLLAQSRVDAENIAAQAKAASDAVKASAKAEKEGITREEKGLEDIRSSIRDRFAEDPELADAVSSRILGAGKDQIGNIAGLTGQDRAAAIDHVVEMANLAEQQDRYARNPYGFDAPTDAGLPMPVEMREPRFWDDAGSRGVLRAFGAEVLDLLPFTDQTVVRDQSGRVMPAPKNERTQRAIREEIKRSALRNKRGDN